MTTTPDDGPESLVLRYLRKIDAGQDAIRADLADLKLCMGSVEQRLSLVERGLTVLHEDRARVDHRLDRMGDRLARVERRLDLREEADAVPE